MKEINLPHDKTEPKTTVFVNDYNYMKNNYNISHSDQNVKLYFDKEII